MVPSLHLLPGRKQQHKFICRVIHQDGRISGRQKVAWLCGPNPDDFHMQLLPLEPTVINRSCFLLWHLNWLHDFGFSGIRIMSSFQLHHIILIPNVRLVCICPAYALCIGYNCQHGYSQIRDPNMLNMGQKTEVTETQLLFRCVSSNISELLSLFLFFYSIIHPR